MALVFPLRGALFCHNCPNTADEPIRTGKSPLHKTIKYLLNKGIGSTMVDSPAPPELSRNIYQGGARFQRSALEFIH